MLACHILWSLDVVHIAQVLPFFSPTEKERHLKVFYHNQKGDGNKVWSKDFCYLFVSKKDGNWPLKMKINYVNIDNLSI